MSDFRFAYSRLVRHAQVRACATATRSLLMLLVAILLTACFRHTVIRPTELPRMTEEVTRQRGDDPDGAINVTLERPSGDKYELEGAFDMRLTLMGDAKHLFQHPVKLSIKDDRLIVSGREEEQESFRLQEVENVELIQPNGMAWAIGGGIVAAITITVLLGAF